MSPMPAPHPPAFRRRAVELARQGDKPPVQLAKDLGVSRSCLQNWLRQADADDYRGAGDRLTSAEKKELAELHRRNKQLEMENDILNRASAYFARENVLPKYFTRSAVNSPTTPSRSRWPAECSRYRPRDITTGSAGPSRHANSATKRSPK